MLPRRRKVTVEAQVASFTRKYHTYWIPGRRNLGLRVFVGENLNKERLVDRKFLLNFFFGWLYASRVKTHRLRNTKFSMESKKHSQLKALYSSAPTACTVRVRLENTVVANMTLLNFTASSYSSFLCDKSVFSQENRAQHTLPSQFGREYAQDH